MKVQCITEYRPRVFTIKPQKRKNSPAANHALPPLLHLSAASAVSRACVALLRSTVQSARRRTRSRAPVPEDCTIRQAQKARDRRSNRYRLIIATETRLVHTLPGSGAVVGPKQEHARGVAGGHDHPFAQAELHLPRLKIRYADH